jgi:imidazolonepropionase-like amidohydrolase
MVRQIEHHLRSYLAAGVTTVLDTGIQLEHAQWIQAALDSGAWLGPDVYILGPVIGPPDGYPKVILDVLPGYGSLDEIAQVMDAAKAAGAIGVKVPIEEGFVGRMWPLYDAETRAAIGNLAQERDLRIFAHAMSPREYRIALDMGATVIVHPLDRYSPKIAKRLAKSNIPVLSTISIFDNFRFVSNPQLLDEPSLKQLVHADLLATARDPGARRFYHRAVIEATVPELPGFLRPLVAYGLDGEAPVERRVRRLQRRIRKLHRAGVRIALGSDSGNWYILPFGFHGVETHYEFELLAGAIGAEEALLAATRYAAEVLGLEEEIGTLAVGKRADLVIIDGRPLDDPHDLWNVTLSIKSGTAKTPEAWMRP